MSDFSIISNYYQRILTVKLFPSSSKCLARKYLTADIYAALRNISTDSGYTLDKAIQSGVANPDSSIGIYAGDEQSYSIFSQIFQPIISHYHSIPHTTRHPTSIIPLSLPNPDPQGKLILSSRIRVARNIEGFSFTNNIHLNQRKLLEKHIVTRLLKLQGELTGGYTSFENLEKRDYHSLVEKKLLFKKGDRFQDTAGFNRDFPACRGVFVSNDHRFRVWVNEEDHLRIIVQDTSADIIGVYNHFCRAIQALDSLFSFIRDDTYGFLTSCPTNIGTAMRAGVHIRLNRLSGNRSLLDEITTRYDLQIRGTAGEKTAVKDNIFDISNRQRYGISEVEIIRRLHQGLSAIIKAEQEK